jgi:hypothetical protein
MNPAMSQKSGARFTEKQGHYLAFIHTSHGRCGVKHQNTQKIA